MASRATQDPVENLLRDIEGQMEALRQNIQDGAAVYLGVEGIGRTVQRFQSRMERFGPLPPLPAADVEDSPPPVYSNMENTPPPVYSFFWKEGDDIWAGACLFLILNAVAKALNAPTGTFSERLDKTRKGLLLGWA